MFLWCLQYPKALSQVLICADKYTRHRSCPQSVQDILDGENKHMFTRNCKVSNDFTSRKLSGEISKEYFSYEIREDYEHSGWICLLRLFRIWLRWHRDKREETVSSDIVTGKCIAPEEKGRRTSGKQHLPEVRKGNRVVWSSFSLSTHAQIGVMKFTYQLTSTDLIIFAKIDSFFLNNSLQFTFKN